MLFVSVSSFYSRLLNRNKKTVDETKTEDDVKGTRKGLFGRKKKSKKAPANKKEVENTDPAETSDLIETAEKKPEETTTKKEEIIPETVQSEEESDTSPTANMKQQLPATPAKNGPNWETPITPRDPDGERCNVPPSTQKTTGVEGEVKAKEATGACPVEPEGRNEQGEGETPERRAAARDNCDGGDEISHKMSMEDPPAEIPGLLCGCI